MLPSNPLTWWHSCQEEPSELYHHGSIQGFTHAASNTWLAPIAKTHVFPSQDHIEGWSAQQHCCQGSHPTVMSSGLRPSLYEDPRERWMAGKNSVPKEPAPPMPEWLLPCVTHTHHEVLGTYIHPNPQKTWTIFFISINYSEQNMEMLQPSHCISHHFSLECNIFPRIHLFIQYIHVFIYILQPMKPNALLCNFCNDDKSSLIDETRTDSPPVHHRVYSSAWRHSMTVHHHVGTETLAAAEERLNGANHWKPDPESSDWAKFLPSSETKGSFLWTTFSEPAGEPWKWPLPT